MSALGAADFNALDRDSGIVEPKSGLTFFALDDHLGLLDDDSVGWQPSEITLVLYQKAQGVSNHYVVKFRLFSPVLRADGGNRT